MNETHLKTILEKLGKQAFPDDIESWTPIYTRLVKEQNRNHLQTQNKALFKSKTFRFAIGVGLVVTVFLMVMNILPENPALAATWNLLFKTVSAEQFPTTSEQALATPTTPHTFPVTLVQINKLEGTLTPYPPSTESSKSSPSVCDMDINSYSCRIAKVEKEAGISTKQFPSDPEGFVFHDAYPGPGEMIIFYNMINGGGDLYLQQGYGNVFPSFKGRVSESAIEEVQVGENRGEFVAGDWSINPNDKKTTWNSCCRYRLRWMDDLRWYEIGVEADPSPYSNKDALIQLATHLVDQPVSNYSPRLDFLTNLDDVSHIAEFPIKKPTILPDGFNFYYGSYSKKYSEVRLVYSPTDMHGCAAIILREIPNDKVYLNPDDNGERIKGESVEVGEFTGIYISNGEMNHVLSWQSDFLKITLTVYSSECYGGTYTKEQILEIARSIE